MASSLRRGSILGVTNWCDRFQLLMSLLPLRHALISKPWSPPSPSSESASDYTKRKLIVFNGGF
ncbi:hypothetical protein F2Q70_00044910 [Brassica cretica]|uniref:Uncharacterized protein n=1 Tax=Brassica cretica TaxID=69181 RepID=A0A8S9KN10_BRACR|nr:hypothetical protein F2Q70_00044909 [Brassica cretica]KAF2595251.1 hypothetical protein F2Q70_00044910 [Brassica cretica]KAF3520837.1 hypothetical protein DY000_02063040 [Brassica cretica]